MTSTRRGAVRVASAGAAVLAAVVLAVGTTAALRPGPDEQPQPAAGADAGAPVAAPTDEPPAPAPSAPAPSVPAPSAPAPSAPASGGVPWPEGTSTLAPLQTAPPAPSAEPVHVSVPSLGISSDLLHLGLQADGSLDVPRGSDVDRAAWFTGSPRPGDAGPAVLEGHVSSRASGPSVFADLAEVAVGARVDVRRADGTTASFEVYDVQQFPKTGFPTQQVYGGTPGAELRVITCGGTLDGSGSRTDNVVVFAHLVLG